MSSLSSVGLGSGAGTFGVSRQVSGAAAQEARRAEQAERQARDLLSESQAARSEASRLRQVADQRETQAGTYEAVAQQARRNGSQSNLQLETPRTPNPLAPAVNTTQTPNTPNPYANAKPAAGQMINVSA